jgi:hypothetical protein
VAVSHHEFPAVSRIYSTPLRKRPSGILDITILKEKELAASVASRLRKLKVAVSGSAKHPLLPIAREHVVHYKMVCDTVRGAGTSAVDGKKIQFHQIAREMTVVYPVLATTVKNYHAIEILVSSAACSGKGNPGNTQNLRRTRIRTNKNATIRPWNIIHYVGQVIAYPRVRITCGVSLYGDGFCDIDAARPRKDTTGQRNRVAVLRLRVVNGLNTARCSVRMVNRGKRGKTAQNQDHKPCCGFHAPRSYPWLLLSIRL